MSRIDDRQFEPLLRDAMRSRPQPDSISNLAYLAMELARSQTAPLARDQLAILARMRRRNRWVAIAASVLIAVVVLVGIRKLSDAGLIGGATATAAIDSTNADSSSTTTSASASTTTLTLGVELTAELLVVGMILLSTGIASSRPNYGEAAFY